MSGTHDVSQATFIMHNYIVPVLASLAFVACNNVDTTGTTVDPPDPTTSVSSSGHTASTTTTSFANGGGSVGGGGQGGSSIASGGTETTSEPAFIAGCHGQLTYMSTPVADWWYDVSDDGAQSIVDVKLVPLVQDAPPPCFSQIIKDDPAIPSGITDVISFPCGNGVWTFGLDRQQMLVYVKASPDGGSPDMDWTPPCQ